MILVITCIELKSPWKFFQLSFHAMRIVNQIKASQCVAMKKHGFYKKHYTMSLWRNKDAVNQFARNGDHLAAMQKTGSLAKGVRTFVIEANEFPKWSKAKSILKQKGKLLRYD